MAEPAPTTAEQPQPLAQPTPVVNQATSLETARDFVVPADMITWAKAKGLNSFDQWAKDPEAYKMATSYRETEKFLGGDKIPLPKDMNDEAAIKPIFEKLGMPKEAKEYKLTVPDGANTDFADNFKQAAYGANLTQKQAEKLNTWWNGTVDKLQKAQEQQRGEAAATEKIALEKDWGSQFTSNKEVATRAALKVAGDLGIPRDKLLDGLEASLGLRDSLVLLKYMGELQQVKGDTFEGGEHGSLRGGKMALTPEQAQQTKDQLLKDKTFYQKYQSNDTEARQRLADLNNIIAQGQSTAA